MKIVNKKAHHDFTILDTFEAGIHLLGAEVKSIKGGRMSLEGSFVKITGSEVYLVNAQIFPYPYARPEGYDSKRTRKLLMHKNEILSLKVKLASSRLTLVPLECYTKHGFVKLKIGLGKGKRQYEKREALKKRDMERDIQRIVKGKI
ncbi:SsrA-binding protein SmpB [Candidatus Gottesmanbacteria bacterium]|nr:SsrA-binding protein SmpB [Candidatus Gottesmanbacteria bacterium]